MQSHTQIAMLMVVVSLSLFFIIPLLHHVKIVKERREYEFSNQFRLVAIN